MVLCKVLVMGHGMKSQAFARKDRQLAVGSLLSGELGLANCRLLVDGDQCTILFLSTEYWYFVPVTHCPVGFYSIIKSPLDSDSNRSQLCPTLDAIRYPAGLLPPPPSARRSLFQPHRTRQGACCCAEPISCTFATSDHPFLGCPSSSPESGHNVSGAGSLKNRGEVQ